MIGKALGAFPFSKIEKIVRDDKVYLLKWRPSIAGLILPMANWLLRRRIVPARMLYGEEWFQWETFMYSELYHQSTIKISAHRFGIPYISSQNLRAILQNCDTAREEKIKSIALASTALAKFHQTSITDHSGQYYTLSHGDATVENVIIDSNRTNAYWIDFDTIHEPEIPSNLRHTDDLRAFLYTTASVLPMDSVEEGVQTILDAYINHGVVEILRQWIERDRLRYDLYSLGALRDGGGPQ